MTNYLYDSFEQRVQQSVPSAGMVQYLFDIAGRPQAEMDGAGTLLREYLYLDDEQEAVALWVPSALYFFHRDHLGTPQAITDISGAIVWEGVYRPFGEVDETVTTLANSQRLPGQHADAVTAWFQNWHRDYDPRLGRYLQSDPIGLDGGMNTYLYANATPTTYTDPNGLTPLGLAMGIGVRMIGGRAAASAIGAGARSLLGPTTGGIAACILAGVCSLSDPDSDDAGAGAEAGAGAGSGTQNCPPDDKCEEQAKKDEQMCRMTTMPRTGPRARCWASVQERYSACNAGHPLPPLVMW